MAGLYIHIPFCAKRCLYCDFFSNTDMKFKEPYIDAAIREMEQLITKGFHKEETEQLKHYLDRIMENIGVAEDCCGRKCKSGAKEQKNHNI